MLPCKYSYFMCSSGHIRVVLLFIQLNDLLFCGGVMKLRPKFPLRACPCSANFTSLATMAALSVTWFMFFGSLHNWLTSCSLRRFEFNAIPHFWNNLFLSSSENRFCISLLNVSLSRRRSLVLSPKQEKNEQALGTGWHTMNFFLNKLQTSSTNSGKERKNTKVLKGLQIFQPRLQRNIYTC